ncbi:AAA family ATPase [Colwellia psychrerythraea]|uniref:ATPase associated with various cellular activities AAA_3 n=1 Tax=Colwellia psychrerythraea TaxID=28229 RepID=A0A099KPV4_COLPS|nr:MoxR family ATPase [Colwellia psychrerythraea]KGJ92804.1 ATPase associated with various cellular activities AAA_3 [Colwellia psychrerythraea]
MPQTPPVIDKIQASQQSITAILNKIESVVLGKPKECRLALACLLAQGHLLIEDLPGMGKTTLAHVLATTLGLSYQRTQFTNDLLPADVVGFSIFDNAKNAFELHKGPIFNQVVLADEINRASPKTQSALLEAMAEQQVSIDGVTHELPMPFFVIATQNPLFHAGTYPLPESQLDRFMMRLSLGFPDLKAEKQILLSTTQRASQNKGKSKTDNEPVITEEQLIAMQEAVIGVNVSNDVIEYIIALSHVSRRAYSNNFGQRHNNGADEVEISCKPLSPRATKALLQAAKAMAFINNRDYVLPDDVQAVFYVVCQHRLEMQPSQQLDANQSASSVAQQILNCVDVLNPLGY